MTNSISDKQSVKDKIQEIKDSPVSFLKPKPLHKDIKFSKFHDVNNRKQGIEHEFKSQTIETNEEKTKEIETAKVELKDRLSGLDSRIDEIDVVESEISSGNLQMEHNSSYKLAMSTCKGIKIRS